MYSNMAATMIAPGVGNVVSEFRITDDVIITLSTTERARSSRHHA
jgi:hypothetical protein